MKKVKQSFPLIRHIDDVLPAIEGKEEFIIASKDGYKVINYLVNFVSTFEDPNQDGISEQEKLYRQIRRECRGITFSSETGEIIARKLHKFFNLGEKNEVSSDMIDISKPHKILFKLDGSMIVPFRVENRVIYGSKMGETHLTPVIEEFIKKNPHYHDFVEMCLFNLVTPIFEYTAPSNRIVINYTKEELTLLAMREMYSGNYLTYDEMIRCFSC